jgi:hypothetical protein
VHGEEAETRLVFWGGPTKLAAAAGSRPTTAGDITAVIPDHLVCSGDSFFIGLPIPALPASEQLLAGRTYFVLPAPRFSSCQVLTAASLASLSPSPAKVSLAGASSPFEYITGDDGMSLIRVLPEFIEKVITCGGGGGSKNKCSAVAPDQLCSTPELRKHYMQLVGTRQQRPWSPGLETISEARKRRGMPSPARLIGLAKNSR